jgi:hypothetical protein
LTAELLSSIKLVLSIAAIAVIGVLFNAQFQMKSDIAHYIELAEQFKLEADAANKYADSLNIHISEQEERANAAIARAARLSREVRDLKTQADAFSTQVLLARAELTDPVDIVRIVIPLQDSIIKTQDEIINTQGMQIGELTYAITEKNSTIELLTISRDSLQTILRNAPSAPRDPNKLFGIKLPSRTTTAVVSFITGIIVTVVVLN